MSNVANNINDDVLKLKDNYLNSGVYSNNSKAKLNISHKNSLNRDKSVNNDSSINNSLKDNSQIRLVNNNKGITNLLNSRLNSKSLSIKSNNENNSIKPNSVTNNQNLEVPKNNVNNSKTYKNSNITGINVLSRNKSIVENQIIVNNKENLSDENEDNDNKYNKDVKREENRKLQKKEKICDSDTEDEGSDNEKDVRFIILPDHFFKKKWDLLIAIILIYTAIVLPFRVSFIDVDSDFNIGLDVFFDVIFGLDILINFFSAYIDNEDNIVKNRQKIVVNYLKSWFLIDLFSILPISAILEGGKKKSANFSSLLRIARLPKLYRLVKLTKLFRMVKVVKKGNVNKITKYFLEKLKVNANIERLIYFILGFLILNHLSACIWYLMAKLQDFEPDCWVTRLGYIDATPTEIYIISFYWTLTTVTTVGYGDINAGTTLERMYNLFIMSFGVLMYSFAIGSLSSIVSTLDAKTAEMNQKLQILSSIKSEFKLDQDIYDKVRKVIKYDLSRNQKDKMNFLQELPNKLRIELSKIMHDKLIEKLYFFREQPSDFIAYVAPLLKPVKFTQNDYLYKISDMIDETKGTISFSLSKEYLEKEIKEVKKNNNFGEIEMCLNEKLTYNIKVKSRNCELFVLKKNDFLRLSVNFKEFIEKFLQKSLMLYLRFNDERKRLMKEMEDSKVIVGGDNDSVKKDYEGKNNNLDNIPEVEEGGNDGSEEYNVFDNNNSNNSDNESKNEENSDKNSEENSVDSDKNINDVENVDENEDPDKDKYNVVKKSSHISNNKSFKSLNKETDNLKQPANNSLISKSSGVKEANKRSSDYDYYDESGKISNNNKLLANPDPNIGEESANDEKNIHIGTNEIYEKRRDKINKTFLEKVDKIISFLEENSMIISNKEESSNPLIMLKKLKEVEDIKERDAIIDKIETLIGNIFKNNKD